MGCKILSLPSSVAPDTAVNHHTRMSSSDEYEPSQGIETAQGGVKRKRATRSHAISGRQRTEQYVPYYVLCSLFRSYLC